MTSADRCILARLDMASSSAIGVTAAQLARQTIFSESYVLETLQSLARRKIIYRAEHSEGTRFWVSRRGQP